MSDKPSFQIEELEGNRFAWTSPDGKKETYIPCSKPLWLQVTDLHSNYTLREQFNGNEFELDEGFDGLLTGTAELETNIEVVGIPRSKSKSIGFTLSVPTKTDLTLRASNLGKPEEPVSPVSFGYLTPDWECGVIAQWYLNIDLSQEQFSQLLTAYRADEIKSISLCISVSPLFMSSSYEYSPVAERVDLFMRPNLHDIDRIPEGANGTLRNLVFSTITQKFKAPPPVDDYSPPEPEFNPEDERAKLLAIRLEQVKSSLTFIGWAVMALALVLAFK